MIYMNISCNETFLTFSNKSLIIIKNMAEQLLKKLKINGDSKGTKACKRFVAIQHNRLYSFIIV